MFTLKTLRTEHIAPASLEMRGGEVIALHGTSGSGKTLLLRAIADIDPNRGDVFLQGESRDSMSGPAWRQQVAYLPSESYWWSTHVAEHANDWQASQLQLLGFPEAALEWEVNRLSSGEKQRLALLRALSINPQVLLLDEPTANLDPQHTALVEKLLLDYLAESERCAIWVSHCPVQRSRIANRQLSIHQGKLNDEASSWN